MSARCIVHKGLAVGISEMRKTDLAWLVEDNSEQPAQWLCVKNGHLDFTADAAEALRFCRRCDAEAYCTLMPGGELVAAQHMWYV